MRILVADDERDLNALIAEKLKKRTLQRRLLLRWGRGIGISGHGRI